MPQEAQGGHSQERHPQGVQSRHVLQDFKLTCVEHVRTIGGRVRGPAKRRGVAAKRREAIVTRARHFRDALSPPRQSRVRL